MRNFPRAATRRCAAAAVAGVMSISMVAAAPSATAKDGDKLKQRQSAVQQQIRHTEHQMEHASKQARAAGRKVQAAQQGLKQARAHLAGVKKQLAASIQRDKQMQAQLAAAEQRLAEAKTALAQAKQAVATKRGQLSQRVVGNYEQGDPRVLTATALLNAEDTSDLALTQAVQEIVVQQESGVYAELRTAQAQLATQKQAMADAKADTAVRRQQAAQNLATKRSLHQQAVSARDNVRAKLATSRAARKQAIAARAKDRAALRALKQREQKIKQRILDAASREGSSYNGSTDGFLSAPVDGYTTSPYGMRKHPIYGYWGLHNGIDYGASSGCGTPLRAPARGTVVSAYTDAVYGKRLYVNVGRVNGSNLTVVYNHAAGYRVGVGERVQRGQVLGRMGQTGWSTGCHLHFIVLKDGNPVNPAPYL